MSCDVGHDTARIPWVAMAVAVAVAGNCSSDFISSLGISICRNFLKKGFKKKKVGFATLFAGKSRIAWLQKQLDSGPMSLHLSASFLGC